MAKRSRPRARQEEASLEPETFARHDPLTDPAVSEKLRGVAATELAYLLAGLGNDMVAAPFVSQTALNWTNGITLPTLPGVSKLSTPKPEQYDLQMAWARQLRDTTIANGPMIRRLDFLISGYRHKHKDPRVIKFFNKLSKETGLEDALKRVAWEYMTVGWIMVLPDTLNLMPDKIHMLQGGVFNEVRFGVDNFYIEIDSILAQGIRENEKNFPSYLVEAIKSDTFNGRVPLKDYFFVTSMRGIGQPFPRSPMFPLFEPLKTIENLVETQFAISFAIKQLMLHVKVSGGKDRNGIETSPTLKQLQTAARAVFDGARVATIVTPNTTEIAFVSPEKDIFEATDKPYNRAMQRVERAIRIPMILVDGVADGVSFSTASVVIKAFLQSIRADRRTIMNAFVYPWYEKKAKDFYESDPEKYAFLYDEDDEEFNIPHLIFDESELRNVVEQIALAKFKWQTGAYPMETIMDMFQDDIDVERAKKEVENQDDKWIYLAWEPNQGSSEALLGHQSDENEADRDQQNVLAEQNEKTQLKLIKAKPAVGPSRGVSPGPAKAKPKTSPVGRSGPGTPGRPSSPDARPRSDNTERQPRAGGQSPNARASRSTGDVLQILREKATRFIGLLHNPGE